MYFNLFKRLGKKKEDNRDLNRSEEEEEKVNSKLDALPDEGNEGESVMEDLKKKLSYYRELSSKKKQGNILLQEENIGGENDDELIPDEDYEEDYFV